MKRIIASVLLLATLLCLTACKPSDISDEYYDYGCQALEVGQQYLNGDLTGSEAYGKLSVIDDGIDSIHKQDKSVSESGIATYVTLLKIDVEPVAGLGRASAQEHYDALKETLGK